MQYCKASANFAVEGGVGATTRHKATLLLKELTASFAAHALESV